MCLRLEDDYITRLSHEFGCALPCNDARAASVQKKAEPKMERGESLNILSPILLNELFRLFRSYHFIYPQRHNILFRIESHFSKAYGLNVFLNFI